VAVATAAMRATLLQSRARAMDFAAHISQRINCRSAAGIASKTQ
jgi:hypothetical protein